MGPPPPTPALSLHSTALLDLVQVFLVSKDATSSAGSVQLDFQAGSSVFDHLAAGEQLVILYTVQVTGFDGGSDTQTVTVTVTGTGPVWFGAVHGVFCARGLVNVPVGAAH